MPTSAISSVIETCRIRSRSSMHVLTTALGPFPHRLADSMREKAEARQRARLLKVFEMMSVTMQQRRTLSKGSVVFREGEAASHLYIVVRARALRSRG